MEFVFIRAGEDSCTSIRKCNGKEKSTDAEQTSCLVRVMFTSKLPGVCSFSPKFCKIVRHARSFGRMCSIVFEIEIVHLNITFCLRQ